MANNNQVRVCGYVLNQPKILNEGVEGAEKALFSIRTVHRYLEHYPGPDYQDLTIFYDGREIMPKIKKLEKYDLVDIKGVYNILTVKKTSACPSCGTVNVKMGGYSSFIYPIHLMKLNSYKGAWLYDEKHPEWYLENGEKHPELLLSKHVEISNQAYIIGTVVTPPSFKMVDGDACCKYRMSINRKYYIKTQDELTKDSPWVCSFGDQAEKDARYLRPGSVILFDGFVQARTVKAPANCENCGKDYTFPDIISEFVPYSVEYLQNYLSEEAAAALEKEKKADILSAL